MIKVSVDESYAYDMLSILFIKVLRSHGDKKAHDNYIRMASEISLQVPEHALIHESEEWQKLIEINGNIFGKIEEMNDVGEKMGDAKYIDSNNYQRYLLKKTIQEKYFPKNVLSEQKIGYKNE